MKSFFLLDTGLSVVTVPIVANAVGEIVNLPQPIMSTGSQSGTLGAFAQFLGIIYTEL